MSPPGLLGRSILASVLVAAVASVATALLTTQAARLSAEREQVRVAHVDREIVQRLEAYGRGSAGWSHAGGLLTELAASAERRIVITDVDRAPLARSGSGASSDEGTTAGAADPGEPTAGAADPGEPTAVLDPMAAILAEAVAQPPTAYDDLALPPSLLAARPDGAGLRAAVRRDHQAVGVCSGRSAAGAGTRALPSTLVVLVDCADRSLPRAATGTGAVGDIARLQNAVALDEYRCLRRRDVPVDVLRLYGPPDLVTIQLPDLTAAQRRAWEDCATSALTRHLRPLVAPSAVLYVTETRAVQRGLISRIGGGRIVVALVVILAAAVVASLLASRRVLRPVRRLTAATQEMAAGELATRVPVAGHDEVARLGRSFNEMAAALTVSDEQRRRMVSDVAHELRTPLSNLRGYLEAGRDGVLERDDAWNESLLEEAVLLQHVVDDLAVLAQADAGRLEVRRLPGDVVGTVEAALAAMRGQAEARGITLERTGAASASAPHDPLRMRQVLANLLSNAVRHSPDGAVVSVAVRTTGGAGDGAARVLIEVADRGEGIAEEHLPRVFERFFRADPSRARETGGSGLGLAIVERLVAAHEGAVAAARRPGGGTVFTVSLPAGPQS
ncbi:ATP-binding protein [Pimelobacter simplex]|uniref:ATP-binding protein n=1 Tax=Nocardioides simplex TaxID=2045 RepID=UPI002150310F|nr:ATP-binding protein [Pimelobacter simplex]UUW90283.1 ATP-binding protein [Pimelobacter simplex]